MSCDYWAYYAIAHSDDATQQGLIQDWIWSGHFPAQTHDLAHVSDLAARIQLLAQTIATRYKDAARMGMRQSLGGVAQLYRSGEFDRYLSHQRVTYLTPLGLTPTPPNLDCFPRYSFALTLTFTLRAPYISKDDVSLHIFDNPVRKEKIFQSPMVAATSWKGALRSAMIYQLADWWIRLGDSAKTERNNRKRFVAWRLHLARLFGSEVDGIERYLDNSGDDRLAHWYRRYVRRFMSTNGLCAGRLHFFSTFFENIDLDVINPHDRETGAGEQPIYIECVPANAQGTFMLLYVPFGSTGHPDANCRAKVAQDLALVAEGIRALFTIYGFGAKTSSGFGIAQPDCDGVLMLNYPDTVEHLVPPVEPQLPDSVQIFWAKYPAEDFTLKPQEWRKKYAATSGDQDTYKHARADLSAYQKQLREYQQQKASWEAALLTPPPHIQRSITSFQSLSDAGTAVAEIVRGIGRVG